MEALQIYYKLIKISMRSRMQYRADFISGIISVILLNAVNLGLIGILVSRFVHLNGWNIWDIVFLYSLWMLSHSIYSLFFWHFNTLEEYLIKGNFDQFLTRPVSPLIQFLGREIQYMGIGDILVGISGLSLAYMNLNLNWSIIEWSFLIIIVLSGTTIETSISWILSCLSFWTGRSQTAFFVITRLNLMVQQYPIDIFGQWFRILVTGFIPIAFINYYPSLYLLGKDNNSGNWHWLSFISPVVALIFIFLATFIWHMALNKYTSSGN